MATRIHNFSYSGGTGLLTFVPCTGSEVACKVYIKSLVAQINTSGEVRSVRQITLSTKSANTTQSLIRAHWSSQIYGTSGLGNSLTTLNLVGGCTNTTADWKGTETVTEVTGAGLWPVLEKVTWSGKGDEQWINVGWIRYHIPEYFYMRPNDTLTLEGYTSTFHIELMAISETN
jgi:hypothetical protein